MDDSVSDPSDWLHTSAALLSRFEATLRCQVCKNFYDSPVTTSCRHTFCSGCIHRCLSSDSPRCPLCRHPEGREKLRPNPAFGEAVRAYQVARPTFLELAQLAHEDLPRPAPAGDRKRSADSIQELDQGTPRTATLRSRKALKPLPPSPAVHSPTAPSKDLPAIEHKSQQRDLGAVENRVECPLCAKMFPETIIQKHVDEDHPEITGARSKTNATSFGSLNRHHPGQGPAVDTPLPTIAPRLITEQQLRKKLGDIGIPANGNKAVMMERYNEWCDLVRANCDSDNPKDGRTLLKDLNRWERQGGGSFGTKTIKKDTHPVMRADFDANQWSSAHRGDYQDLAMQARSRLRKPEVNEDNQASST